jgi:nitrate reductase assembly molybdenum cofactor insertion protein NarJ
MSLSAPPCETLLREAAEWRLIGLLFEYPREGWRAEIAGLAAQVSDPVLIEAAREAGLHDGEGAYLAALGPGGVVSPRGAGHLPSQDPGRILADVTAFYEAFQYRPGVQEPADHVAVEAGFVGYLKLKEAFARARAAVEEAEVTAQAATAFRMQHLAVMAEPLARRLADTGPRGVALAAEALLARVGHAAPAMADCPTPRCDGPCQMDACGEASPAP